MNDLLFKHFEQAYLPYKTSLKQYTSLVLYYLQYELDTNIKLNNADTVECVQLLNNSVTKIFALIDREIERCNSFTNGCAFSMLIEAFKVDFIEKNNSKRNFNLFLFNFLKEIFEKLCGRI